MRRAVVVLVFVALALGSLASPADAAKKSKVDTARESAKAIRSKLSAVTAALQVQEAKSVSARQAASAAQTRLANAKAEEAAVEKRLANVKQAMKDVAIAAYMAGGVKGVATEGNLADPSKFARAQYFRNSLVGFQTDTLDALSAARQDLDAKRKAAESAAKLASDRQRAVGQAVSALRASRSEQLRLVGAAEARYQASLKEADVASRSRRVPGSSISLTTVRGITVATRIAGQLDRMLGAASADGMRFGGSGYRSPSGQVAARKRNCGSSSYAIYEMPSSRCHPPTAKPGQSMHEQGLAIDFTYNGSVINSRSNAGYKWLKAHAGSYGFYNLPSEAWHWSVNGN